MTGVRILVTLALFCLSAFVGAAFPRWFGAAGVVLWVPVAIAIGVFIGMYLLRPNVK